jgi:hypothetical protein
MLHRLAAIETETFMAVDTELPEVSAAIKLARHASSLILKSTLPGAVRREPSSPAPTARMSAQRITAVAVSTRGTANCGGAPANAIETRQLRSASLRIADAFSVIRSAQQAKHVPAGIRWKLSFRRKLHRDRPVPTIHSQLRLL